MSLPEFFAVESFNENNDENQDELKIPSDDEIAEYENITVKFKISDTQTIAQTYPNCLKIGDVKKDMGRKFEINSNLLCIKQSNKILLDRSKLLDTKHNEFGIYEFELGVTAAGIDQEDDVPSKLQSPPKLDLQVYYSKLRLADFITVRVPSEENTSQCHAKDIVVEIQNQAIIKPFLGGYKDRNTDIEYLDAFTQTGPYLNKWKTGDLVSRDCQTRELKPNSTETMYDRSTQSFGEAGNIIFVSAATDFTIVPKKYQSYAQLKYRENKLGKIILLQRNIRRYLFYKNIKRAAAEYRRLCANRIEDDRKFNEGRKKRIQKGCAVKTFPRTKEDFNLLYIQVQKWKEAELKRIASMYSGAPRIAEVNILLDKEIQLLSGIERQRQLVRQAVKDFRDQQLLEKMGEPIQWIGYKGRVVEMDLLRTQRARFLMEIYKDLQKKMDTQGRLKLLNSVKEILVHERDCPQTDELLDLIEREQNLLLFTKWCDVQILRKRQLLLFLEVIKFAKEKRPTKISQRMCDVCKEIKPIADFALRTRQNNIDTCKRCFYLKTPLRNNNIYSGILRSIQRSERKYNCLSSYAFVLQVDDIRLIVDKIWHGHSVLSKSSDISDLQLPRWITSDEWSPWNCVLLTDVEARNHISLTSLNDVYDKILISDINSRHMLAKTLFKKLQGANCEFVESGQWWEVGVKDRAL